jgi:putative transcriptional regulator
VRASSTPDADASGDEASASGDETPVSIPEDWRAYRAKLVAQETKTSPAAQSREADATTDGWVHETPLIEQGSVILASTQQRYGFGLHQQYFHKSVMLILTHSPDFTKGIILNRPTSFTNRDGFPLWFGGDVQSFEEEPSVRETTCIHTLTSPAAERMSLRVISGIYATSLECAVELVSQGHASKDDFWTFVGYAGWGPGQLQDELDRKSGSSWRLVSADSGVVLRELVEQRSAGGDSDGIPVWERLMRHIGHGTSEVDSSAGGFADRMLREWVRFHLRPLPPTPTLTVAAVAAAARASDGERSPVVLENGSVLRSATSVSAFTLGRQYLHKALVLMLRTGREGSVGVVLNRPCAAHLAYPASGRKRHVLFGGQLALRNENILWFHRNTALSGEAVGKSGLYRTTGEAALEAIKRGDAVESDFVCVHGILAWGKGALEREVAAGKFVPVVNADNVPWEAIWSLADPQTTQAKPTGVASAGADLWEQVRASEPSEILGGLEGESTDGDEELADLALLKWVDTFLS